MRWVRYKIIIFISFLSFSFFNLEAQEYENISNITIDTKLENYNFTSIAQDSNGFLWLGTTLGLYRYDGYHFIEFNTNTNPSLLDNTIKSLLIDGENLWIGSNGGLNVLNTTTNVIVNLTNQKNDDKSISNNYVTKIYKDKSNTIWVGYNTNKICKYLGNNQFQNFDLNIVGANYKVKEIFEVSNNSYIIQLSDEKLGTSKIINARLTGNLLNTKIIFVTDYDTEVLFKTDAAVFLIQENELYKYDVLNERFVQTTKLFNNIEELHGVSYTDNENTIYLGTKNSNIYYLTSQENLSQFKIDIATDKSWINTFFKDNSGILWVGTTSGLYKLKKEKKLFKKYLHSNGSTVKNKIGGLLQDYLGDIYAVNQEDLFKYDSITEKFNDLNWIHTQKITPLELKEYDSTNFLIGLQGDGIGIYNKTTNIVKDFFEDKKIAPLKSSVLKLCKDKQSILWIGTNAGLDYYDIKNDSLVKMLDLKLFGENLNNDIIFDIKIFKDSMLWVGTSTGLYLLKVDYSTIPLKIEATKMSNIPYEIHAILIKNNTLWLATLFNGLLKYNSITKEVTTFNESIWLTNNTVYSLLPGAKNELWIGTLNGLSRFDTITKQFINFYDYNGLAGNQFNSSSQLKTKKGNLFFGGQNGITSFLPTDIEINSTNFNLNLINISWYNHRKNSTFINNKIRGPLKINSL